ncbi:hypothetical protein PG993_008121 [Apiospora rasikravindrae]|uniref:Uncharacterized protein n=1 Tax=Apiospora rasikravindrae TaxID=990691 RepID=A0ABR1T179_9PEZI
MVLSSNSPWHYLSWGQRAEIDTFVDKHYICMDDWHATPKPDFHAEIVNAVFLDWNPNVKPDVPNVHQPKPTEFSFSLGSAKEEEPELIKLECASGVETVYQSDDSSSTQPSMPSATLTVPSPCTTGPEEATDPIRITIGSKDSACRALEKAHRQLRHHYNQQNRQVLIFLIRKYLYNTRHPELWSPELDGKPGVSDDDIRKPPRASEYLKVCMETMGAAAKSLDEVKHHF